MTEWSQLLALPSGGRAHFVGGGVVSWWGSCASGADGRAASERAALPLIDGEATAGQESLSVRQFSASPAWWTVLVPAERRPEEP